MILTWHCFFFGSILLFCIIMLCCANLCLPFFVCKRTRNDRNFNFQVCGIDQLWNIAVQAKSTEVSWAAISYLNSLYINGKSSKLSSFM